MQISQLINNIKKDEFGRPSGILALAKKIGESSHDLVDQVRRVMGTRQVGHAGALDVFASGLVLILVGKATKLSDKLLNLDKEYVAEVLLGVSTDTQDLEGTVSHFDANFSHYSEAEMLKILKEFVGEQLQYVSLFSSVKVNGNKLRILMRDERFRRVHKLAPSGHRVLEFVPKNIDSSLVGFELEIPRKHIVLHEIELLDLREVDPKSFEFLQQQHIEIASSLQIAKIRVKCSKGTYIRQLAEDIGAALGTNAMLVALKRTQIADVSLNDIFDMGALSVPDKTQVPAEEQS
jgi:tRNA pseudouridine55 synthase